MLVTSILLSSLLLSVSAVFDDSLARNFMLPLSSAAYSDAPQQCLDSRMAGAQLVKQVTVKCDYFHDKCSGFTFVDENRTVIGLAFRGSDNPAQMTIEIQESMFQAKVDFKDGGQVSKYFNDAFQSVWEGGLEEELDYLFTTYPGYDLWITGHSLGGALASLAAAHIVSNNLYDKNRITLYTFGQPRVGDQKYADVHDSLLPISYRVVHDRDIVVHSPPQYEKYNHHKTEVFYDNAMKDGDKYTICFLQEDKNCSDQYVFELLLTDHTTYYGQDVSSYGKKGCK